MNPGNDAEGNSRSKVEGNYDVYARETWQCALADNISECVSDFLAGLGIYCFALFHSLRKARKPQWTQVILYFLACKGTSRYYRNLARCIPGGGVVLS